jgi:hypothetical protein
VANQALEAEVMVFIRGKNPSRAAIAAVCQESETEAWITPLCDLIPCKESSRRQFKDGLPFLGAGGDVGLMQLCDPGATCSQRWNWAENLAKGIASLSGKRREAIAYLNKQVNKQSPPGNYPNELDLSKEEVILRETIQRYNGGTHWKWDAATGRLKVSPPINKNTGLPSTYVRDVLACGGGPSSSSP